MILPCRVFRVPGPQALTSLLYALLLLITVCIFIIQ